MMSLIFQTTITVQHTGVTNENVNFAFNISRNLFHTVFSGDIEADEFDPLIVFGQSNKV